MFGKLNYTFVEIWKYLVLLHDIFVEVVLWHPLKQHAIMSLTDLCSIYVSNIIRDVFEQNFSSSFS